MPKVVAASAGPSRLGRGRRVATSLAEINVVPLVDVMLVLLIIFMVTAPMIQRGVDVKLPVTSRASQIEGERIFLTVPLAYRQSHIVYLGDEPIHTEILKERIRQKMETAKQKQVYLRGDGGVQFQDLMDVFSELQKAGVETIGIVTRMPGER
ncbi:MAG: biopolymer transporter ExbD [Acidobacteriia bacterium]|nr:biopolymer transporter ExbD [Terriglobia bacterium]